MLRRYVTRRRDGFSARGLRAWPTTPRRTPTRPARAGEERTSREIRSCLKRFVARRLFRLLEASERVPEMSAPEPRPTSLESRGARDGMRPCAPRCGGRRRHPRDGSIATTSIAAAPRARGRSASARRSASSGRRAAPPPGAGPGPRSWWPGAGSRADGRRRRVRAGAPARPEPRTGRVARPRARPDSGWSPPRGRSRHGRRPPPPARRGDLESALRPTGGRPRPGGARCRSPTAPATPAALSPQEARAAASRGKVPHPNHRALLDHELLAPAVGAAGSAPGAISPRG